VQCSINAHEAQQGVGSVDEQPVVDREGVEELNPVLVCQRVVALDVAARAFVIVDVALLTADASLRLPLPGERLVIQKKTTGARPLFKIRSLCGLALARYPTSRICGSCARRRWKFATASSDDILGCRERDTRARCRSFLRLVNALFSLLWVIVVCTHSLYHNGQGSMLTSLRCNDH